jgi:hypothetical protein
MSDINQAAEAATIQASEHVIWPVIRRIWRAVAFCARVVLALLLLLVLTALGLFFIGNFLISTPKVGAYRTLHPSMPECADGLKTGWTILTKIDPQKNSQSDDGDWKDPSNDELYAIQSDKKWETLFRCSIQRHIVPAALPDKKPLDYRLAFLEFQESGEPYSLTQLIDGKEERLTPETIKRLMPEYNNEPPITQLDVLKKLLSEGSNYVIVFVHGWRHNASIGDSSVADVRHYAAHVARFLEERCVSEKLYCDTRVTAIYIGWRGARVDETALQRLFGSAVGGVFAEIAAGATLFDRKPVSEQVAPGAISALRTLLLGLSAKDLEGNPKPGAPINRMIVFGHSLGGNLLATGLKDDLVKLVRFHKPGDRLPPVLGDLVVLINPASEASKWTGVQREVWRRIAYRPDDATPFSTVIEGHNFFPVDQKPIIVSVTAALAFPAGGLRDGDCSWIYLDVNDRFVAARQHIKNNLEKNEGMFKEGIGYDWATHDLFPAFKFDFRPMALWFDRMSARLEGQPPPTQSCKRRESTLVEKMKSAPTRAISRFLRTFPFQNTDQEYSHTIGHLDPPRPAGGILAQYLISAAPFGTTHELIGAFRGRETHNPYATLADGAITCPPANRWLKRARLQLAEQNGTLWDSTDLGKPTPGAVGEGSPTAQFVHGFVLGGTAPIARANDPFWNMRAFDNALSRHDGYRLTSFICAMNQLVMDDITAAVQPPK